MEKPTELQVVYKKAEQGQKCSAPDCNEEANYTVAFVDYYPSEQEWFFEQDSTCPFLCEKHREENEAGREGTPKPRNTCRYPYTKQHPSQGWSEYLPIEQVRK